MPILHLFDILIYSFMSPTFSYLFFFFFNDTATTEIYTLSLHDALPISFSVGIDPLVHAKLEEARERLRRRAGYKVHRSEEHTSELQSQSNLVCRLLLEKKKKKIKNKCICYKR